MNLVILTAFHHRHALNRIFALAMNRLRDSFGIQTCVAVTRGDTENIDICKEHKFHYVEVKNRPVSNKFNLGLSLLPDLAWSHVMILGSDDIPSNRFIEMQMGYPDHDVIVTEDMWFWGLNPHGIGFDTFTYLRAGKAMMGAGRCISRRAIEAVGYKLWPDGINSGLDGNAFRRISDALPDLTMKSNVAWDNEAFIMDVKYELHINSLSPILRRGIPISTEVLWDYLPGDECKELFELRKQILDDQPG